MKSVIIPVASVIFSLCLCGCEEDMSKPHSFPLSVEADEITKAAIEEMLKSNPQIYIPRSNIDTPGSSTEYTIKIVKPRPGTNYGILRVAPDPNGGYSMMIIDPSTKKPPSNVDPNFLDAIIDEINKRRQEEVTEK